MDHMMDSHKMLQPSRMDSPSMNAAASMIARPLNSQRRGQSRCAADLARVNSATGRVGAEEISNRGVGGGKNRRSPGSYPIRQFRGPTPGNLKEQLLEVQLLKDHVHD
jgi:hypothetical protein